MTSDIRHILAWNSSFHTMKEWKAWMRKSLSGFFQFSPPVALVFATWCHSLLSLDECCVKATFKIRWGFRSGIKMFSYRNRLSFLIKDLVNANIPETEKTRKISCVSLYHFQHTLLFFLTYFDSLSPEIVFLNITVDMTRVSFSSLIFIIIYIDSLKVYLRDKKRWRCPWIARVLKILIVFLEAGH
jgi:hypothetical protein